MGFQGFKLYAKVRATRKEGALRLFAFCLGGTLVLTPCMLGISDEYTAKAVFAGLKKTGIEHTHFVTRVVFAAGDQGHLYRTHFWCTPIALSLGGMTLLWFASQKPFGYFLTCLMFAGVATLLVLTNIIVSIHLHERGLPWTWAHYPGVILLYLGSLMCCLAFADFSRRRVAQALSARSCASKVAAQSIHNERSSSRENQGLPVSAETANGRISTGGPSIGAKCATARSHSN